MSVPAAAAASASSSSGTKRPLPTAEADRDGAEKKSRTSSIECTSCHRGFNDDDPRVRVLPCTHRVCLPCLEDRVRRGSQTVLCPQCRRAQPLHTSKSYETPRALANKFPSIREINEEERGREEMSSPAAAAAAGGGGAATPSKKSGIGAKSTSAAAATSSSSGSKRPLPAAAAADRDDDAEKKSRTPTIECPVCKEDLHEDDPDVRVLPCTDRVCLTCLAQLIRLCRGRRSTIVCPHCQRDQPVHDPTKREEPEVIANKFPSLRQFRADLRRHEKISSQPAAVAAAGAGGGGGGGGAASSSSSSAAAAPSKPPPCCSEENCRADATHYCLVCGLQCAAHEKSRHLRAPDHVRLDLADQKRKQEESADERRNKIPAFTDSADKLIVRVSAAAARHQAAIDLLKANTNAIAVMSAIVDRWKAGKAARAEWMRACHASKKKNDKFLQRLESAKSSATALCALPTGDLLAKSMKEMEAACGTDILNKIQDDWEDHEEGAPLPPPHIAVPLVKELQSPSLLPWLTADRLAALQGFLPPGKTTVNAQLLYKATFDGWLPKDFYRCCHEMGPTLTIIKAAGSGYLFGAYTAVSWPKPTDHEVVVPDPSGASFLFSLTNQYDRPFRMSLVDRSGAITVGSRFGLTFGREVKDENGDVVKHDNLYLMSGGKGADEKGGNFSNPMNNDTYAYRLDPWTNDPPDYFQLNNTTLAGQHYFTATEIEVYAM